MIYKCEKCKEYGLRFERKYHPTDWLAGQRNSRIWIIGLNPRDPIGYNDNKELIELIDYFNRKPYYRYFKTFKSVSEKLYNLFGEDYGVASTDLVKCSSREFPPKNFKKKAQNIIDNCKGYLKQQILKYKPKIIICNGSQVSVEIKKMFPKENIKNKTSYKIKIDDSEMIIVLSGFIMRIDNYNKRRLGLKIERYMNELFI